MNSLTCLRPCDGDEPLLSVERNGQRGGREVVGIDVYLENQVHERTYAGPDAGNQLTRVLARAKSGSFLAGVDTYGDTMFNLVQLRQLDSEIDAVAAAYPALGPDVDSLRSIIQAVIRDRGYV
jgi:hypothetical protein